jgi:cupin 2 domain-containing protein
MIAAANIFDSLPAAASPADEQVSEILARPNLRIERIVSTGQASPPGFWYDQPWDEWVIVLSGSAKLSFESEADVRPLGAGDYLFIPAHARHRVDWTASGEPTIWLAVHYADSPWAP